MHTYIHAHTNIGVKTSREDSKSSAREKSPREALAGGQADARRVGAAGVEVQRVQRGLGDDLGGARGESR